MGCPSAFNVHATTKYLRFVLSFGIGLPFELSLRLQKMCAAAGIDYNVDIYTLRHTFATNLYIIGVPEKDRQEYMGHVSGSPMTNDVYTTFTPDVKAENIYDIYGDFFPKF